MDSKDLTTGQLDEKKQKAEQLVTVKDGQFYIKTDQPISGIDSSKAYPTRELAVEAAFNALKSNG